MAHLYRNRRRTCVCPRPWGPWQRHLTSDGQRGSVSCCIDQGAPSYECTKRRASCCFMRGLLLAGLAPLIALSTFMTGCAGTTGVVLLWRASGTTEPVIETVKRIAAISDPYASGPRVHIELRTTEGRLWRFDGTVFRVRNVRIPPERGQYGIHQPGSVYKLAVARSRKGLWGTDAFAFVYTLSPESEPPRSDSVVAGIVVTDTPELIPEERLWEDDLSTRITLLSRDLNMPHVVRPVLEVQVAATRFPGTDKSD